jgi:hypothetical protein
MKLKSILLTAVATISFATATMAQNSISYKRQMSYKQCNKCSCKKDRSYSLISNNLTPSQKDCAVSDMNSEIRIKELLQGGTSGGLFAAYNAPQEGCGDDCDHVFVIAYDQIETVQINDCLNEQGKENIKQEEQKKRELEIEKENIRKDGDGKDNIAVRIGNKITMDYNFDGQGDKTFSFGNGSSEDQYLVGDWDGDGKDNIALRRGNQIIMDYNFDGQGDKTFSFGNGSSENQYLVGDWDGK